MPPLGAAALELAAGVACGEARVRMPAGEKNVASCSGRAPLLLREATREWDADAEPSPPNSGCACTLTSEGLSASCVSASALMPRAPSSGVDAREALRLCAAGLIAPPASRLRLRRGVPGAVDGVEGEGEGGRGGAGVELDTARGDTSESLREAREDERE